MAKHWIAEAIGKPGALHREMGVPQGQKIPAGKLAQAASAGGLLGRRARLAETLKGFHHRASGGRVEPGKGYLVGEHGTEMLKMGKRGGHVFPHHLLRKAILDKIGPGMAEEVPGNTTVAGVQK